MVTYTLGYVSSAVNLDPTKQANLMVSSAPLDVDTLATLGLTVASDTPSVPVSPFCQRVIKLTSVGGGPIPDGQPLADTLTEIMTSAIRVGLNAAPVIAFPVSFI